MELFEMELQDAADRVADAGLDKDNFAFKVIHLPPDPEAAGMFTARYEVEATNRQTGKVLVFIGGIGLSWVDDFERALKEGAFD